MKSKENGVKSLIEKTAQRAKILRGPVFNKINGLKSLG
jgi:hypothetical protein